MDWFDLGLEGLTEVDDREKLGGGGGGWRGAAGVGDGGKRKGKEEEGGEKRRHMLGKGKRENGTYRGFTSFFSLDLDEFLKFLG